MIKNFLLCALLVSVSAAQAFGGVSPSASETFQQGMAALQSNDYPTGLHLLEQAIVVEPDNARYASEYRQAIIRDKEFDRSVDFFAKQAAANPGSANLHLNYGFAFVDKIPSAGSITQVLLANQALGEFTKAVNLRGDWVDYYTRGAAYLFWPKIFDRAPLGVADLEKVVAMQRSAEKKPYFVRGYLALGDGYCKTGETEKARALWREGLEQFPDSAELKERLAHSDDELTKLIENNFDPNKRVDTDLKAIWSAGAR